MTRPSHLYTPSIPSGRNLERVAIRRRDPQGLFSAEDAIAWARKQEWFKGDEHLVKTDRWYAWFRARKVKR